MFSRVVYSSARTCSARIVSRIFNESSTLALSRNIQRSRFFHIFTAREAVKPYLLADIGEGITECRVVSWYVKPGDSVNQFDAICEVQSDKATVEITSRFDGVIKTLHYEVDDTAIVGKPLLDIEVDDGISDETVPRDSAEQQSTEPAPQTVQTEEKNDPSAAAPVSKNNGIMTPAVRHLLKEHNLSVEDIQATGNGGRILKEDVQRHLAEPQQSPPPTPPPKAVVPASIEDQRIRLTPIQSSMSKVMTASLSIPHFLYTHAVDVTGLNSIRRRLNAQQNLLTTADGLTPKITALPIILKALSHTFRQFPTTNSHYDGSHKELLLKGSHDFGIAMDTPSGLLVPVVRNVQNHTIVSLAAEVERLSKLAKDGRLAPSDLTGATFTVSNIGSIGGDVVSPVIVPPQVGIVALGRVQDVPVFEKDDSGAENVAKKEKMTLSWRADHRVLDGATVAQCAQMVQQLLENVERLGFLLK